MPYSPTNQDVYTAAYAGALAGMSTSNRVPKRILPSQYANVAAVAGAWAEAFDTIYGATFACDLELGLIQQLSQATWQNRAPRQAVSSLYLKDCQALVAIVVAASAYYAGQSLNPCGAAPGGGCVTNATTITGLYGCAENDGTIAAGHASFAIGNTTLASGDSSSSEGSLTIAMGDNSHAEGLDSGSFGTNSHAEGEECTTGYISLFSIAANGVTVTITGDVTAQFVNGNVVNIFGITPAIIASVTRTIVSPPTFGGVDTTFDIDSAIDLTTTDGYISDPSFGDSAHTQGQTCKAIGTASDAAGSNTIAIGTYSCAGGEHSQSPGNVSVATGSYGQSLRAGQFAHGAGSLGEFAAGFGLGNAQWSRQVRTIGPIANAGNADARDIDGSPTFVLDANKVYSVRVTFLATDGPTPTLWTKIVHELLISTDNSANPTIDFDTITLTQDSTGGLIVTSVYIPDPTDLGFNIANNTPGDINALVTLEWSELIGPGG